MSNTTNALIVLANNSTNVRNHASPFEAKLYASAWPLRALLAVSPKLAARAAAKAFFTTFRPPIRPDEAALIAAFEPLSVPFGRARLPAWSYGSGPLVLLSHGWSGRGAQLAPFAAALATAGFRAVIFDHPAHGDAIGTRTTLPEMRDALVAVDAWLGGAKAIVAHSMGTILTTLGHALPRASAASPLSPERIVYIAPPVEPASWPRGFARKLGLGEAIDLPMQRATERLAGVTLDSLDPRPVAKTLSTPLLIVHDRADREVPFAAGEALAQMWRGSELVETEGLGHIRVLRDGAVGERILAFLAPLATGAARS